MIKEGEFIIDNNDIKDMILKAKSGDKALMEEIVRKFMPFVIKTARGIYIRGQEMSDLVQIGRVSIIKAVKMYDIDKGNGFTSYVTNAIKRNFYTLIRDNVKKSSYCSLNSLNEEGFELIDILVSGENIEEDFCEQEEKIELRKALNRLSEKEKEIIHWFYFENKTLQQYAELKAIGYRTAVERKKRALIKLRTFMQGE